ncbi:hypothetical protein [[Phormidium] sp. ETS-05]|uniref:hypothetical protein n=1 Tax=[Phormidium] sp. ETS-05 TaxID=222819 RepID=UPI0018EED39E|nr:hypothetical protein [[Phormidium] sp. ETS-05]
MNSCPRAKNQLLPSPQTPHRREGEGTGVRAVFGYGRKGQRQKTPQVKTCGYMNQTPEWGLFYLSLSRITPGSPSPRPEVSSPPVRQIFTNDAAGLDIT